MKRIISLIIIFSLLVLTGCKSKTIKIPTVSNIELGKGQFIEQLVPVKINNTNDTITITSKVKWEVPEHEAGTTVSFAIAIPYIISIDGINYNGIYELGDSAWNTPDNNPKYDFKVTNLTGNGDIEVLITNKA